MFSAAAAAAALYRVCVSPPSHTLLMRLPAWLAVDPTVAAQVLAIPSAAVGNPWWITLDGAFLETYPGETPGWIEHSWKPSLVSSLRDLLMLSLCDPVECCLFPCQWRVSTSHKSSCHPMLFLCQPCCIGLYSTEHSSATDSCMYMCAPLPCALLLACRLPGVHGHLLPPHPASQPAVRCSRHRHCNNPGDHQKQQQ